MEDTFLKDYSNLLMDAKRLEKNEDNPFFHSKYVPLPVVLQEAKRLCLGNNFIFIQRPDIENDKPILVTELIHNSGEKIISKMPIVAKDNGDPQKVCGGLTYMRRYSLTSLLGIEEEDDDGNKAAGNNGSSPNEATEVVYEKPPFDETKPLPENKPSASIKQEGGICPNCGGKYVKNPKTGKIFCENKCWLKK